MSMTTIDDARRALNAGHAAHLLDYITDTTTRDAIAARQFGAGGGDAAVWINQARTEGAEAIVLPVGETPLRSSVTVENFALLGEGRGADDAFPYGQRASVVTLWEPAVSPILLGKNPTLCDLTFYWPNQRDQINAPTAYQPLLSNKDTTTSVRGLAFSRNVVVNAYEIARLGGNEPFHKSGRNNVHDCRLFALHRYFSINHMPDWLSLRGTHCGVGNFADEVYHYGGGGGAGESYYLRAWIAANSVVFHIRGDATTAAPSSRSVDGVTVDGGVFYGGFAVFDLENGTLANLNWQGGMVDGFQRFLRASPNSSVAGASVRFGGGSYLYNINDQNAPTGPAIEAINPHHFSMQVRGEIEGCDGELIRVIGPGVTDIDAEMGCEAFAAVSAIGVHQAIHIDAPNADVSIDLRLKASGISGPVRRGVKIAAAQSSRVGGQFVGIEAPVEVTATGQHLVDGLVTRGTVGDASVILGPGVKLGAHALDKPRPNIVSAELPPSAAMALASDTARTLTFLTLPPGEWDVNVIAQFVGQGGAPGQATTVGYCVTSLSLVDNALGQAQDRWDPRAYFGAMLYNSIGAVMGQVGPVRLPGGTAVYLVAQAGFAGPLSASGKIFARKVA